MTVTQNANRPRRRTTSTSTFKTIANTALTTRATSFTRLTTHQDSLQASGERVVAGFEGALVAAAWHCGCLPRARRLRTRNMRQQGAAPNAALC